MADINGIPYVEATDLVSAYPATSLALATELDDQLASKLDKAGGKILQIVRATDETQRSTTSTSLVDVTGMSVTITPLKSDSAILVIIMARHRTSTSSDNNFSVFAITDISNNIISGGGEYSMGTSNLTGTGTRATAFPLNIVGYSTPATTSPVIYKLRFRSSLSATTTFLDNDLSTGQMYAIEVSA